MNQALRHKLIEVTGDTLEKLAFIFAFPAETPPAMDSQRSETVRVNFTGPVCGGVELSLPAGALPELALNMLGAEEGESFDTEQQHDALKELANVICGNLLPTLAGDAAEFSLCPPLMVSGDSALIEPKEGNPTESTSEATGYLMLEAGACRVRLTWDPPASRGPEGLPAGGGHLECRGKCHDQGAGGR